MNILFNFSKTAGGNEAEEDLTSLKFKFLANSKFFSALNIIVWCIVGTPEYQVIFSDFANSKNLRALNPLLAQTEAPDFIEEAIIAIRPWI